MKKSLVILSFIPLCLASCGESTKYLKDVYKDYFTIGAAFNQFSFETKLVNHFNSLTAENEMKWSSLHSAQDTYTYDIADEYIKYAKEHNLGVRGHTLVWHEAINEQAVFGPKDNPFSKEKVLEIELSHIDNVVKHFKDDVYCWDVVNEVIEDGNDELKEDNSNIYRQSNWYKATGDAFIKEAFKKADAVLKELNIRDKVKLFYNDYDNAKPQKKAKTIAMIKDLQANNIPIDGIGLQCHYHLGSFNPVELEQAIIDYAALGLDIHITEFDCEIYDRSLSEISEYQTYSDVPQIVLDVHASIYDRAFEIFRRHKDKISNVSFWGISDDNTYMNDNENFGYLKNYPYIFDYNQDFKPAYYQIAFFKEGQ